jgi:seryl-tRNA synthetase
MIDIRELRRDPDAFLAKVARKGAADLGRQLIEIDAAWRAATAQVESWRAEQKRRSGVPSGSEIEDLGRREEQLPKIFRPSWSSWSAHGRTCSICYPTRWLLAILENFQNPDGSISIPEVLRESGATGSRIPSASGQAPYR